MCDKEGQAATDYKNIEIRLRSLVLSFLGVLIIVGAIVWYQHWANWQFPLALVFFLIWPVFSLIMFYYRRKYGIRAEKEKPKASQSSIAGVYTGLIMVGGLLAWLIDVNFRFPIKLIPFVFGVVACSSSIKYVQKGKGVASIVLLVIGLYLVGLSLISVIFNIPANSAYSGVYAFVEVVTGGVLMIVLGLTNHLIPDLTSNPNI